MRDPTPPPAGGDGDRGGPGAPASTGDDGCREARDRLHEYLDGELPPPARERIDEHLEACGRCHRRFDLERRFLDGLREKGLSADGTGALRERIEASLEAAG